MTVLWAFILAVFFSLITPGPGVLTTAGIGANYGFKAGLKFVLGLFIGNGSVFLLVAAGLFSLIEAVPYLRMSLAVLSILYLLYLAAKIAFAGTQVALINPDRPPGFVGGVLLQFINPKAYAVNAFVLSNFPLAYDTAAMEVVVKMLVFNLIWIPIHLAWLGFGAWLQRLNLSAVWQRAINVGMAVSMLMVVALAAISAGI